MRALAAAAAMVAAISCTKDGAGSGAPVDAGVSERRFTLEHRGDKPGEVTVAAMVPDRWEDGRDGDIVTFEAFGFGRGQVMLSLGVELPRGPDRPEGFHALPVTKGDGFLGGLDLPTGTGFEVSCTVILDGRQRKRLLPTIQRFCESVRLVR